MNLKNDYFLLYHGKNAHTIKSASLDTPLEEYYPIYSLILTVRKNILSSLLKLESFKVLLSYIYTKEITTLEEFYPLQSSILSYLKQNNAYNIANIIKHIEYLKTQEILPLENYNRLISLFKHTNIDLKQENDTTNIAAIAVEKKVNFQEKKEILIKQIQHSKKLFVNKALQDALENTLEYIENQTFSIGITGVINSGKSTMLNALIGKEVLGSSVVPETANLTILKYAEPKAEVYYWNEDEWSSILKLAKSKDSIKAFVQETEKLFALELKKYIQKESYSETIDIEDISQYTSVQKSLGKCNLVKYVNLYYDLKFLQNGIEIVDTPGLDDPVVQREEITKEYLSGCDLMIHLMNVNQSATHKDIEFIVDAILYQNISKVLIVITQIDSVTPKEVEEVVSYTKKSIKEELEKLNKSARVEYILEHIDFISISAKVALSYKINPQKSVEGMSLQESGILKLESYLEDTLFGSKSGRSELIIYSATRNFEESLKRQLHLYRYELEVLSLSKSELKSDLCTKKENRENFIHLISEDIHIYKDESIEYVKSLDGFLEEEFIDLKSVIHQRLYADISYSYTQNKTLPEEERLSVIIQTAAKDGIVDIIRDYRYKLFKKEKSIFTNFEKKIIMFHTEDEYQIHNSLNIEEFFKNSFTSGLMSFSIDALTTKIIYEITNTKASKYETLNKSLIQIIEDEFSWISHTLSLKIHKQAVYLIDELYIKVFKDVKDIEDALIQEEKLISNLLKGNRADNSDNDINLIQKIKELESIHSKVSL